MTALQETVVYDVQDCRIWPMLTDLTTASPTYGTAIDVPGISTVSMDPTITANELKGDGRVMANRARQDAYAFKATYGKVALGVLATILNSQKGIQNEGSGSSEIAGLDVVLPRSTGLFAVRFAITDVDLGLAAVIVTAYKCRMTAGTMVGGASDTYGQPTFDGDCTQPYHNTDPNGTRFVDYTPTLRVALHEAMPDMTSIVA